MARPTLRITPRLFALCALICLSMAGCTRTTLPAVKQQDTGNLTTIGLAYNRATNKLGRPPKDLEELTGLKFGIPAADTPHSEELAQLEGGSVRVSQEILPLPDSGFRPGTHILENEKACRTLACKMIALVCLAKSGGELTAFQTLRDCRRWQISRSVWSARGFSAAFERQMIAVYF